MGFVSENKAALASLGNYAIVKGVDLVCNRLGDVVNVDENVKNIVKIIACNAYNGQIKNLASRERAGNEVDDKMDGVYDHEPVKRSYDYRAMLDDIYDMQYSKKEKSTKKKKKKKKNTVKVNEIKEVRKLFKNR